MIPIIEEAVLSTGLDCRNFNLLNISKLLPVPNGLVDYNDPALDDKRVPPFSSVRDYHVAEDAGIAQSKLSFDGVVPPDWIGTGSGQFARGSDVLLKSTRGVPNGYAPLDPIGKLLSGSVAFGTASGSVSHVRLMMPEELVVANSDITSSGSFNVSWASAPDASWLGVYGAGTDAALPEPGFISEKLPMELIPPLPAAKFTSGVFPMERLPVAIGVGEFHAPGILPDPGITGDPVEYLGRDMGWHHFGGYISYQPTVPPVQISENPSSGPTKTIIVRSTLKGSVLFYRVTTEAGGGPGSSVFTEVHTDGEADNKINLTVTGIAFIEAYASKSGYNNSPVSSYAVQPSILSIT